jgi:hypothetical protein
LKVNKNKKSFNPSTLGDKNEGSGNPPRNAKNLEKKGKEKKSSPEEPREE